MWNSRNGKIVTMLLVVLLLVSNVSMNVEAKVMDSSRVEAVLQLDMKVQEEQDSITESKPNIRALLYNCMIRVNSSSNGMRVTFMTDCVQVASSIGVKDVEIKQKVWYGWKTVATSSGSQRSNSTSFMGEILYTGAVKGETYRIKCTHYANADEYTEVENELDIIFTY